MNIFKKIINVVDRSVYRLFGYEAYYDADELKGMYVDFFKKAKEKIWILGGEFSSNVFDDLAVVRQLEKAADRGVEIVLICGDSPDTENEFFWLCVARLINLGKLEFLQLDERPDVHFAIVDNTWVHGEYPHLPKSQKRDGFFTSGSTTLMLNLTKKFKKLRKQAKEGKIPDATFAHARVR